MRKIWFVGLLALSLSACEKDDICDGGESVTPNVVIDLYDRLETENLKSAVKIAIIAQDFKDTLFFYNRSKIDLPLQINTTETVWDLVLYIPTANNDTLFRKDQLKFNYTPEALYVSKACGYKTIFHDFNAVKTSNTSATSWIQSIYKITNEISNTNNAHIQLYY
ncbi:MAG: hypothetical protein KIG55_09595 [Myroides sp.]|jgi:hypothetical protein|nr:hypothetical protein [Myroides sp.]